MTDKPKVTALNDSVKVQLSSMTLQLTELKKDYQRIENENKALKKQNVELASVIENDLKADLKVRIMARGEYKETDLEDLTVEQLQMVDETLSRSKGASATFPFKSINAGTASTGSGRMTVGNLYGKSRKEILESGGEF